MKNFDLYLQNSDGTGKVYLPFNTFDFTEELNNDKSGTVTMSFNAVREITDSLETTIRELFSAFYKEVYIQDKDENIVFGGFIKNFRYARDINSGGNITINLLGFFSLLYSRYTEIDEIRPYQNEDLIDIAVDLVNYTQGLPTAGADFGIDTTGNGTSRNADRTYVRKSIGEAIVGLSNANIKDGLDFEITNDKLLRLYYPAKGQTQATVILEDGVNFDAYDYQQPLVGDMANEVTAVGDGDGLEAPYATETSEDVYKENYYLLQRIISAKDTSEQDTLSDKALNELDEFKFPRDFVQGTCRYDNPVFQSYGIGDRIKVIIPKLGVNNYYRVIRRNLRHDRTVSLEFSSK